MCTKYWRWSIAFVTLARLVVNQAGAAPAVIIGVVTPQGQPPQVAEPMRQSLISELKAHSIEAIPLSATGNSLVNAEAQAKRCRYVLYTHLEKHSSGGLRGRWSTLTRALQGTAEPGASYANVKQGDTMEIAYRLIAIGSASPVSSQTFDSDKAAGDGQDIVTPLLAQVGGAVSAAADGTSSASSPVPTVTSSSDPATQASHSSIFGGVRGHRSASGPKPAQGAMTGNMDCAKLASMPNAPMSVGACESLQRSQQMYSQAAADPAASRAGDEEMTCAQITAELKQQQYAAPDRAKVAEANATVQEQQSIQRREYANAVKQQAENQAAVNAASAADTATELATGGLVRGRALQATEKTIDARNRANNERVIKEDLPVAQKMVSQTADLGGDFSQQLQANPRLARLMQLADTRHCKGGG